MLLRVDEKGDLLLLDSEFDSDVQVNEYIKENPGRYSIIKVIEPLTLPVVKAVEPVKVE
jgi:hypothetical protein